MDRAILAGPAPLPDPRRKHDLMTGRSGRSPRGDPSWSRPTKHGPASAVCRFLGRLFGVDPDRHACWCIQCTLHHLGVYRREHVRHGGGAWVRTTVFGIRIRPDRYAFPLSEHR